MPMPPAPPRRPQRHNMLSRFVNRMTNAVANSMVSCASRALRAFGQKSWARYIRARRLVGIMERHATALQSSIDETHVMLKEMSDALTKEQNSLLSAAHDVRAMADKRKAQRRDMAVRLGRPPPSEDTEQADSEALMMMTDYDEMRRIEDLRVHMIRSERLRLRITKMQNAKLTLQRKHAEFEGLIGDFELSKDFERIGKALEESDIASLDPVVGEIVNNLYSAAGAMEYAQMPNFAADAVNEAYSDMPEESVRTQTRDIVALVYARTVSSPSSSTSAGAPKALAAPALVPVPELV